MTGAELSADASDAYTDLRAHTGSELLGALSRDLAGDRALSEARTRTGGRVRAARRAVDRMAVDAGRDT
ncbi:hypothetical protein HNR06_002369 [Nocardiopsis arvandica]|uniref:Uncharacterized protein n=1 Tax=Nocardiopsis sinuspersici TaxID=501010 RepID=A0A7Y9XDJ3_9ACTN|nr:hypothetical protein [Nocardiopsis sinuspersici]NYH52780.1 hypothetical protein [Nocardiopsis sinuspersici]